MKTLRNSFAPATALIFLAAAIVIAQSDATRPRRVGTATASVAPSPQDDPISSSTAPTENTSANATTRTTNTAQAYVLLQRRQFAEAARAARSLVESEPENAEAWKITGFAEMGLEQYEQAATNLERALVLQRAAGSAGSAGSEDANTSNALAQALMQTEKYERALPLLVAATTRRGAQPGAQMFYLRGLAEYRTNKLPDAESSFNSAVRIDSRHAPSHFILGRIQFESDRTDTAIVALNRATAANSQFAEAWSLLAYAYMRRAASTEGSRADADYLNAVRAGERLYGLRLDARSAMVYSQALINARQSARAISVLARHAQGDTPEGTTALYLLGVAHSRSRNYPRAIAALEAAAERNASDPNIRRELGYAYEVTRQYARALAAYERGAELAPDDAGLREAVDRVRPLVR